MTSALSSLRHLTRPLLAAAAIICAFSTPGAAQTVVGTAVVEGREVTLFDDQTWAFKQTLDNCTTVTPTIQFCGDSVLWRKNPPPNQAIAAQFARTPKLYLQYIGEGIGKSDGINHSLIRNAVLQYAAVAMGTSTDQIPVLYSGDVVVSDLPAKTLAYFARISGTDVVFQTTVALTDDWVVQIQTYEVGAKTLTETHKKHHAESLTLTRLATP